MSLLTKKKFNRLSIGDFNQSPNGREYQTRNSEYGEGLGFQTQKADRNTIISYIAEKEDLLPNKNEKVFKSKNRRITSSRDKREVNKSTILYQAKEDQSRNITSGSTFKSTQKRGHNSSSSRNYNLNNSQMEVSQQYEPYMNQQ